MLELQTENRISDIMSFISATEEKNTAEVLKEIVVGLFDRLPWPQVQYGTLEYSKMQ